MGPEEPGREDPQGWMGKKGCERGGGKTGCISAQYSNFTKCHTSSTTVHIVGNVKSAVC